MNLLGVADAEWDHVVRWFVEKHVQILEDIALGRLASETKGPSRQDATEHIFWALASGDGEAGVEGIEDYMRAGVREWWQGYPEKALLTELFRRAECWRSGTGTDEDRREPSCDEARQVAPGLLVGIPETEGLDSEWEFQAVAKALAAVCLPPIGVPYDDILHDYIGRSKTSLVHYLALVRIYEELNAGGYAIPSSLRRWWEETAGGSRGRPPRMAAPPGRPVDPVYIWRDVLIQFAIEVLSRIRIQPQGKDVSGIAIVSEVAHIPEETVRRIYKARIWRESIRKQHTGPWVRRYADAISRRVRPYHSS